MNPFVRDNIAAYPTMARECVKKDLTPSHFSTQKKSLPSRNWPSPTCWRLRALGQLLFEKGIITEEKFIAKFKKLN